MVNKSTVERNGSIIYFFISHCFEKLSRSFVFQKDEGSDGKQMEVPEYLVEFGHLFMSPNMWLSF